MVWQLFYNKNKKIIILAFIILLILISAGILFGLILKTNSEKKDNSSETLENINPVIIDNSYTKAIPHNQEISDLKYFTTLSPLQKEMLWLMKENFITLTTDWDKSIQEKKAKYKNDFRQVFQDNQLKPVLKPSYSLGLLGELPKDENGKMHEIRGYDNFYKLNDKLSKKWHFTLKHNLKFADGKDINNQVVIYCLKKQQEIMRLLLRDEDCNNLKENIKLFLDTIFIQDNNPLVFTLSYENPKTLKSVITLLNNCILFPKYNFESAQDKNNVEQNNYGTKDYPFVSYGPYQLKTEQGYNSGQN
ncbi:hypothetical protein CWO85_02495 [Candidatus Phytoplasma ziziphi]|uniref:Solute-binding protein family 5 domain-containing protein n=1 Tax=Ziziphus jujuba witches'-broom phytoplasma TaxID=135727 RepID=A0A660HMU9_ZIZJU|nr:hypothetical protein [Candidatus Phytoplasma ziziphi]AYJ01358.1 hypothetical protein CWO85_02495 [Candidatus Phytoplasma ziziphi]